MRPAFLSIMVLAALLAAGCAYTQTEITPKIPENARIGLDPDEDLGVARDRHGHVIEPDVAWVPAAGEWLIVWSGQVAHGREPVGRWR